LVFALVARAASDAPPPQPPPAAGAQADANLPQVTVAAKRQALEPRVREFVGNSLFLGDGKGVPRWGTRVCPAVVGFSKDGGEFIAARLSQIARTAGVPLDGERCSPPNLYVFATVSPAEFLKKWAGMHHWKMFGEAMPHDIDAFVAAARPIKAWYNTAAAGADRMIGSAATAAGGTTAENIHAPKFSIEDGTRLVKSVIWSVRSAIVVIDKSKMQGVSRDQLADYIAMCAFSRIKPGATLGDAPTILKLFDGPAAQAPAGLSAWDQAFLESLYHTDPKSTLQRQLIVTRMMSHIVPEGP
jgi:hypothetical protein